MFTKIDLLRNVGQFDSVTPGNSVPLKPISLVYAENGRGKTTLAAILRSLKTNNPDLITERHRLGALNPPHIVITSVSQQHTFQNGTWSAPLPDISVFDDNFIAENVCSGIDVVTEHRQNLHELILGAQGVSLNSALRTQVGKVEEHNRLLREKEASIPPSIRGDLAVDAFCRLGVIENIDAAIAQAEKNLAAARSADIIRRQPSFIKFELPSFDIDDINTVLERDLPSLQSEAAQVIKQHFLKLGKGAEAWIADGMHKLPHFSKEKDLCPFCVQKLEGSSIIVHYENYFSEAYASLKKAIVDKGKAIASTHEADIPASFERIVRIAVENATFWREFTEIPNVTINTAEIALSWKTARELVLAALRAKFLSPLEKMSLSEESKNAIKAFNDHRLSIAAISESLVKCNPSIVLVKERIEATNIPTLSRDLDRLKATQLRHRQDISLLCQSYLDEKNAKSVTEQNRTNARSALDQYRTNIFTQYEAAINIYLAKFNAGFRLSSITSVNNRGGSSCTYNVLINNIPIPLTSDSGPTFKNTLSAGDRNTLALAFFFASLDQDPGVGQKILIIDDPMTSLDEHRSLATIHEIRDLARRVKQVIILSHSKPFLCQIWEGTDTTDRSAVKISRSGQSSTVAVWDVRLDLITEHDKRHILIKEYIDQGDSSKEREAATALRYVLEAFLRVAYPVEFPPGTLLGHFQNRCSQVLGTSNQVLNSADTTELRRLMDYSNKFHHDTNPAYATELINDQELLDYCKRILRFTQKQ